MPSGEINSLHEPRLGLSPAVARAMHRDTCRTADQSLAANHSLGSMTIWTKDPGDSHTPQ